MDELGVRGLTSPEGFHVIPSGPQQLAGIQEGDVLDGKYRVERLLGIGGMGVVVAARHIQLDEKVALKILRPEALGDADAIARFALEARAAVKIKSEHVARVTDVGTLPSGAPYIVMEYLDGGDLDAWIEQRGPLAIEQAAEFILQACVAVADLHALGIVHRDLKPANLFCVQRTDRQLSIKLLDFGVSRFAPRGGSLSGRTTVKGLGFPQASSLIGSPLYMSPEQMKTSGEVDARADIWALGIILFELLTGRVPYSAETMTELAIKIATEPTPSLRGLRPEVPPELDAIIGKCLEKDRRQRYGNVAEFAFALLPFAPRRAIAHFERIEGIVEASGLSADAVEAPPSPRIAPERSSRETLPPFGRTIAKSPRRKATVLGASIVGAAVLLAIAGAIWERESTRRQDPGVPAVLSLSSPGNKQPVSGDAPMQSPPRPRAVDSLSAENRAVDAVTADEASEVKPASRVPVIAAGTTANRTPPVNGASAVATTASTRAMTSPTKPAAQTARCGTPFYFDTVGNRLFKKECL
jgi:eukaryotic-like serine/threonine-protein kinase